ncbi:MAG: hypothetical protein MHM6MM_001045 [Cercozoa sp. M6MM]
MDPNSRRFDPNEVIDSPMLEHTSAQTSQVMSVEAEGVDLSGHSHSGNSGSTRPPGSVTSRSTQQPIAVHRTLAGLATFSHHRVASIMRLHPEVHKIQKEAVEIMMRAASLFLQMHTEVSFRFAASRGHTRILSGDVGDALTTDDQFSLVREVSQRLETSESERKNDLAEKERLLALRKNITEEQKERLREYLDLPLILARGRPVPKELQAPPAASVQPPRPLKAKSAKKKAPRKPRRTEFDMPKKPKQKKKKDLPSIPVEVMRQQVQQQVKELLPQKLEQHQKEKQQRQTLVTPEQEAKLLELKRQQQQQQHHMMMMQRYYYMQQMHLRQQQQQQQQQQSVLNSPLLQHATAAASEGVARVPALDTRLAAEARNKTETEAARGYYQAEVLKCEQRIRDYHAQMQHYLSEQQKRLSPQQMQQLHQRSSVQMQHNIERLKVDLWQQLRQLQQQTGVPLAMTGLDVSHLCPANEQYALLQQQQTQAHARQQQQQLQQQLRLQQQQQQQQQLQQQQQQQQQLQQQQQQQQQRQQQLMAQQMMRMQQMQQYQQYQQHQQQQLHQQQHQSQDQQQHPPQHQQQHQPQHQQQQARGPRPQQPPSAG